jgi:hypothetical protein
VTISDGLTCIYLQHEWFFGRRELEPKDGLGVLLRRDFEFDHVAATQFHRRVHAARGYKHHAFCGYPGFANLPVQGGGEAA